LEKASPAGDTGNEPVFRLLFIFEGEITSPRRFSRRIHGYAKANGIPIAAAGGLL
jgi:hypothetical protein